jgi:hypothetical protein
MKLGFTLIVIAAIAGLVGCLAPIDGAALLPLMLKFALVRGLAVGIGFAAPLGIGLFGLAKARMSKPLAIAALAGFAAAGVSMEIWEVFKRLGDNIHLTALILAGAVVLGVIGSLLAVIKGGDE